MAELCILFTSWGQRSKRQKNKIREALRNCIAIENGAVKAGIGQGQGRGAWHVIHLIKIECSFDVNRCPGSRQ